jgi:membrane-associated phospholipid phosphatase
MIKTRIVFSFIAAVTTLQLHAETDTLFTEEGLASADTHVDTGTVYTCVTDDIESASQHGSLYAIGENGPVNIKVPGTKNGRIFNDVTGNDLSRFSIPDTISAPPDSIVKPKWYRSRLVRSSLFPLAMIGYSLTVMKDNGLYSSYDAKRDIRNLFGAYRSPVDDYLIWAPYAELGVLNLFKIRCKTDALNTSLLILKSEILMTAIVFPVKELSGQLRPDSSNYHSFPSGHTANAFVAASVVHKEYRHLSPWYGVGAYTVATSVALFRMINNKHWQSDVIAGAGIGLLATHIVYATHRYRWGRKDVCFLPVIGKERYGGALVYQF